MLRKLIINDWVHVSSGIVLEDRGRMVKWHVPVSGDFCWEVGWNVEKWGDHRIERRISLYLNVSVGLSMCDCLIETVKYIWVNIWCMLDWILSQNCRNTFPLHTAVEQLRVQKLNTLLCPTNCLQTTLMSLLTRWKNIKIQIWLWFYIVWTVFNIRTTWYFHYYTYCLGKTRR